MNRLFHRRLGLAGVIVLVLAGAIMGRTTVSALAGATVDPNTLQPVPPNATCRDDGRQIICDTFVVEDLVNEPITDFDLPCGTIYETSHYRGDGTRWYVNRLVVQRHVAASLEGAWSLSPTGAGPTVRISGHYSVWTLWTTPGDNATAVDLSSSGSDFKVSAPGFGVIVHNAGLTELDGTHHGITGDFTADAKAEICAALGS